MGLYGVIAFLAARRVREVGIRIALGASGNHVVFSFLRHGMWAAMLGIAVGSAAAFSGARVLSAWLIGIEPNDSLSYCIAITLAIGISALASYIPARRASRVDPVVALRAE
jgi:ABC-type lipoprotein release transport system permease subunit